MAISYYGWTIKGVPDRAINPPEYPEGIEEECPTCEGNGAVNCSYCHGSGLDDSEGPNNTQLCLECEVPGSGKVKCPDCGGEGYTIKPYEPEIWDYYGED